MPERIRVFAMLAVAAIGLTGAAASTAPAPQHATVVETIPADGEAVAELPEYFAVTANEELVTLGEGDANRLTVQDADGLFYGDGCFTIDGPTIQMASALGAPGAYTMTYQVVSADGHTIDGQVAFDWEPTDGQLQTEGAEQAPTCGVSADSPAPDQSAAPVPTESPTPAEDGGFPFIWFGAGVLAIVAAIVIWTWRRGMRRQD